MIGTFGAAALAANQVAMSVGGVLYMVPLGIAGAVAIRVAQAQGAGRDGALRPVAFAALALATLWLAGSALLLALGGRAIAEAMVGAGEPEVVALAAAIFTVFALMQVFDGLQSTMLGALRGLSDTAWPALVSMVAYWGVGLPLAWMLAVWAGLGAGWVWVGWLVALAGAGAALVVRFLDRTAAPRLSPCAAGV
jgi:MATE family multidrug resistance protein